TKANLITKRLDFVSIPNARDVPSRSSASDSLCETDFSPNVPCAALMTYIRAQIDDEILAEYKLAISIENAITSQEPRESTGAYCDCCGEQPVWAYRSRFWPLQVECWGWCFCESCAGLIEQDKWTDLEVKFAATVWAKYGLDPNSEFFQNGIKNSLCNFQDTA